MPRSFRIVALGVVLFGVGVGLFRSVAAGLEAGAENRSEAGAAETPCAFGVPNWDALLAAAEGRGTPEEPFVVAVPKGVYLLDAERAPSENVYLSNTALDNPKKIGLKLRGLKNVVVDFQGSEILTRGLLLAAIVEDCENVVLKNLTLDSVSPAMAQTRIVRNDENGIAFRVDPPVVATVATVEDGAVVFSGDGWRLPATFGIAFDPRTRHTLRGVGDVGTDFSGATIDDDGLVRCPNWKDGRLVVGTVLVLRPETFYLAGIFVNRCKNFAMEHVDVRYAPAKAVLVQRSENVRLSGVSIAFRDGADDARFFTANADAVHFSCCKGKIVVENGVYEAMMDDAINVHGIYVKTSKKIDEKTVEIEYRHSQANGFEWAVPGDEVAFLNSRTMEHFSGRAVVESVRPVDRPTSDGAKVFELTFREPIPESVRIDENCALENLTQTPEVVYRNNTIRDNRARGCLFSTRKSILVEGNTFDCVSGTAILFCGDANGWYESGPCQRVAIRGNRFINCMTSFYQYCEAPISIYPEIPDFDAQRECYDGGFENSFLIENNVFDTFDRPILYARSTDGIVVRKNTIRRNRDFAPVAPEKKTFVFDKSNRVRLVENRFEGENDASGPGFDAARDVDYRRSPSGGLRFSQDEPFGDAL